MVWGMKLKQRQGRTQLVWGRHCRICEHGVTMNWLDYIMKWASHSKLDCIFCHIPGTSSPWTSGVVVLPPQKLCALWLIAVPTWRRLTLDGGREMQHEPLPLRTLSIDVVYIWTVLHIHKIDRDTSLHTHSKYAQPKCFQERFWCRLLLQEMPKLEEDVPHMWKVHSLLARTSTINSQERQNFLHICSAQSENLRILRIPRLRNTLARSQDCATIARNLSPQCVHVQKPSCGYERSY